MASEEMLELESRLEWLRDELSVMAESVEEMRKQVPQILACARLAASDSPSQSEERNICDAGEGADPEARAGIAKLATQVYELEERAGAPSKVWVLVQAGAVQVFSSYEAADSATLVGGFTITEYEVHADRGHEVADD